VDYVGEKLMFAPSLEVCTVRTLKATLEVVVAGGCRVARKWPHFARVVTDSAKVVNRNVPYRAQNDASCSRLPYFRGVVNINLHFRAF